MLRRKRRCTEAAVRDPKMAPGMMNNILKSLDDTAQVTSGMIKSFLHTVIAPIKEELTLDWVSMGIIIGKKGDKIGQLDLAKVSTVQGTEQGYVASKAKPDELTR